MHSVQSLSPVWPFPQHWPLVAGAKHPIKLISHLIINQLRDRFLKYFSNKFVNISKCFVNMNKIFSVLSIVWSERCYIPDRIYLWVNVYIRQSMLLLSVLANILHLSYFHCFHCGIDRFNVGFECTEYKMYWIELCTEGMLAVVKLSTQSVQQTANAQQTDQIRASILTEQSTFAAIFSLPALQCLHCLQSTDNQW